MMMTDVVLCDVVNPGVPELSVDTAEQDMREGHSVQFTCNSTGGNPAPSLTWYRNGSQVSADRAIVTPPAVKFGDTVSTLTWTLSAADHLANFSCSASADAIYGSLVYSAIKQYHVQCKSFARTVCCVAFLHYHTVTLISMHSRDSKA